MCEVDSRPVHGQKGAEWVQTLIQRRIERGGIVRRDGRSDESRGRQPKCARIASRMAARRTPRCELGANCDMRKATGAFDMSVINMFLLTFILAFFGFCFPSIPRDLHRKAARRHRTVRSYGTRSARRDTADSGQRGGLVPKKCTQRNVATTTQLSRLERYHRFEVDDVRC